MTARPMVYHVAVPSPLYGSFDYLPPAAQHEPLARGVRVRVPFGPRREVTGVILGAAARSELPGARLKRITRVLDESPTLPASLLELLEWAASYYHHPLGEVLGAALPQWLREGRPARAPRLTAWRLARSLTEADQTALARASVQRRVLAAVAANDGLDADGLAGVASGWREACAALERRGLVVCTEREPPAVPLSSPQPGPELNSAQRAAADALCAATSRYECFLLHGVTGSGKTEVYLAAAAHVIAHGRQVLMLVPEIGLTPQLVTRVERRLGTRVALLHSGLGDAQRFVAWLAAREGSATVVLGTRSAVFTPLPRLGLVVVDEEHDPSYKQQEGFRYSARDLAVMRASRAGVPIVLGSATPSLESYRQARQGGYRLLELPERTGAAALPRVELIDLRRLALADGLSHPLRAAIGARLERGEQSLIFLNRRGFAPAWMCHGCGEVASCRRCDARLTYHQRSAKLVCHHCGAEQPVSPTCAACGSTEQRPLGEGTERVESALARAFPAARILRIDRDSTRRKGTLEEKLAAAHEGRADILVGTQMLSKGHDFPNVTLVGVLNADQGLYSADFRAPERLVHQILQVAGRAGRADKPGEVLIQTWHPEHPLFAALVRHDYQAYADVLLAERREADFPPFSHLAVLRAESPTPGAALAFLQHARRLAGEPAGVQVMAPVPSAMEKRAGRYRAQLLAQATSRKPLHRFLDQWVAQLAALKEARRVRWSLDVDPADLF